MAEDSAATFNKARFLTGTYWYMFLSLIVSFCSAFLFARSGALVPIFARMQGLSGLVIGLLIFGIEMAMIHMVAKRALDSPVLALFGLLCFSVFDGATLSIIFNMLPVQLILVALLATSVTFGAMSLIGVITKKNLASWSKQLFGALIALIVVSFIEYFFVNSFVMLFISAAMVVVTSLFIVYDNNQILEFGKQYDGSQGVQIIGAMNLSKNPARILLFLNRR